MSNAPESNDESADPNAGEITLFLHGYNAVKDQAELDRIRRHVQQARPDTTTALLKWEAGDASKPFLIPLTNWIPRFVRARKTGKWLDPRMIVVDGLAVLSASAVQYRYYEDKAVETGKKLGEVLADLPVTRINMVGHSLGASVISHFLESGTIPPDKSIGHAVFLGSASKLKDHNWPALADNVDGFILNFWSGGDWVLAITPDQWRRAGRNPLPSEQHPRIENIRCKNFGHHDYWDKLGKLLDLAENRFGVVI